MNIGKKPQQGKPLHGTESKGVKPTPFFDHAQKYWDMGLPVFPLKPNSKPPAIKGWQNYKEPPSPKTQTQWLQNFPDGNIGLAMGKVSGLVVVDCDDPAPDLGALQKEFGMAGIIVRTASGKAHLFYAYTGEKKIIKFMGRNLDIIGDGGYVVMEPSVIESKGRYTRIEGDWMGLGIFPTIQSGALWSENSAPFSIPERIETGTRNKTLFNTLRQACCSTPHTYNSLLDYALEITHGHMSEPLPINEVRDCVKSVWRYHSSGNLVPPNTQHAMIWELPDNLPAEAYRLFVVLKKIHSGLREEFWIIPKALVNRLGSSEKTIKKARNILLKEGLIRCTYKGGSGPGDPARYVFKRETFIPPIQ